MRSIPDRFTAWLARTLAAVFYRSVEVRGEEHVPASGPVLFVANHGNSLVDPLLLIAHIPRTLRFLAKSTLWQNPAVRPLLEVMGRTVVHQGGPGAGQHTKLVNQTLIASNMVGVCEGLLYALRAGLDPERVLESVASGAAGSWSLANLAPRMLAGDFAPGFFVEHFLKDMSLALEEADRMGLELPGLALARRVYAHLAATGRGRDGTQALVLALGELSGLSWPPERAEAEI